MNESSADRGDSAASRPSSLADLIRAHDWSRTSLGPRAAWPQSLKTVMATIENANTAMCVLWGDDGVLLYNDAYSIVAADRHPDILGMKVREAWPEAAEFNSQVMERVRAGEALTYVDREFYLQRRSGPPDRVWLTLNFSTLFDVDETAIGVLGLVVETTDKVRAEQWRDGELERFRALFEQAPGFMAMLAGPEHVFELVNPAYTQLVGHRDVIGKTVRDALPDIEGQGFYELLDQVYASGVAFSGRSLPVSLQPSPGAPVEARYVDLVYAPVRGLSGEVIGLFVQGTDVTDRLLAEQAMRAGNAQFEAFAQAMPNHVWTAPADGQLDWFNDTVYAYSGTRKGELDGNGWVDMVHADDVAQAAQQWATSLATGAIYDIEFRLRRADGAYRWHLARAVAIRDEDGAVTRWIGTNTDIEDQKKTAEALSQLNVTLEQQVTERTADRDRMWLLSTDVMLVADFDAVITAVNPAWRSLLGWNEGELLGRSFMTLIHPDDYETTLAEVDKLRDGATTFNFTNRARRRDGSYCVLSWTAVPDNRFIHAVGRDVTAETEAAQTLARTEEVLRQSQKMEAVGQLTGGIAHDFNNMLAVVIGSLDLLKRRVGVEDPRARRYLDAATDGARRAAVLTQRLLAFARQQPLQPEAVDLNKLVAGMSDLLRHSLGADVRLETVLAGGLWRTHVDPNQLENVILNLAVNARDAMPEGGRLTIETQNAHLDERYVISQLGVTAGQYVMIAVTDDGSGMPPDVVAKAFDPFFTTKAVGRGTGLGLSQAYGFIKQSNGHVKIYSEPGEGTTIKVYLPRLVGDVAVEISTDEVLQLSLGARLEVVLVVEDEPSVRQYSVDALSELGYRVLEADGAAAALRLLDAHPEIELLFTDIVMPEINGRKLADEARRRRPNLKVLFTTGYTRNAVVHNGVLDPGVALIGKPFGFEELAAKVREVLDDLPKKIGDA